MHADKNLLVMIDAVDGAGKDTVARALVSVLETQKRETLSIAEPTYEGIGKVIREVIMKDKRFDARSTAMAYALDREVLYRTQVLPFLAEGNDRVVIQVRGLMSSLTYQTIQAEDEGTPLTVDELLKLPGNKLELSRPPDLILLLMLSQETAQKRLAGRTEKIDGDKFDDPEFQARVSMRYRADDVLKPFQKNGSRIVFIDAEQSKEEVSTACAEELKKLLN